MFSASWIYPNSVKYVPADGFFGIRITLNSSSAAGGVYDAPLDTLVGWEKGCPFPFSIPLTPSASSRGFDPRKFKTYCGAAAEELNNLIWFNKLFPIFQRLAKKSVDSLPCSRLEHKGTKDIEWKTANKSFSRRNDRSLSST